MLNPNGIIVSYTCMKIRGTTQQIKEVHTIIRMNIFRAHTFSIRLSVDIGDQIRAPIYTSHVYIHVAVWKAGRFQTCSGNW